MGARYVTTARGQLRASKCQAILTVIDSEIDIDVAREWESIEAIGTCTDGSHSTTEHQLGIWRPDLMLSSSSMVCKRRLYWSRCIRLLRTYSTLRAFVP
jgi:hypothetical protein